MSGLIAWFRRCFFISIEPRACTIENKANLRDLVAATGLVILLKFDSNRRFFSPCDLEIWWMITKNYRAPLLHYIKLCVLFQSHRWILTGVTVWRRSIRVKIGNFLSRVTLKFDRWPWKTIGHLFYVASSFVHHFIAISEFKLKIQSGNAQFGSKSAIFFVPCDLEIWPMTLKNKRAPLSCCLKLSALFRSHRWIQTGVTVRKRPIWVKIDDVLAVWPWNLTDDLEKQ